MASQHYCGSCQCGAVSYEVNVDLDKSITCNCSRCQRLGWVISFTPRSSFTLHAGENAMTQYTFNKHHIHHQFCKFCGIEPFAFADGPDGTAMVAINANCLEGVDPRQIRAHPVDGKSR